MWQRKYLSENQLEELINVIADEDAITDNMAIDSECEGDSDAEDNLPDTISRHSTPMSLRKENQDLPESNSQLLVKPKKLSIFSFTSRSTFYIRKM